MSTRRAAAPSRRTPDADAASSGRGSRHTPAPSATRWPMVGVTLAGVLFAMLAVAMVGLDRAVRWDEVTYLAQVTPGQPDVWFGPQRARGMTIVLAPVALFGAPTALLRLWLIVVHAAALVVAFQPWARRVGWTAPAAAGVVAVGWVPLYFAVEGYPNLLAAFAAVAVAGHLVAWARTSPTARRDRTLVAGALALAVVAWLRPTESVWIAAALTPVVVLLAGRAAWRAIVALLAGGFVGWLPWLIEAIVRFDGPFARLADARATSASGEPRNSLIQYLNLVEGPVRRVVADPVLTGRALVLLVSLAALVVVGIVGAQRRGDTPRRDAAVVGAWCAFVMVVPYLVLNAGINLRYLLPGMLLGALPIGAGIVGVVGALARLRVRPVAVAAGVVLLAVAVTTLGWQAQLARDNADAIAPLQARPVPLGAALAEAADGEPCAFLSNVQWPEIQWHSGCLGEVLDPTAPTLQCPAARRDLAELAATGHRIFVLARGEPPFAPAVAGWPVRQLDEPEDGVWRLYERPADAGDVPSRPTEDPVASPCLPSRAPDTTDATLRLRWSRD